MMNLILPGSFERGADICRKAACLVLAAAVLLSCGAASAEKKPSAARQGRSPERDISFDPVWSRASMLQQNGKLIESAALYESLLKRYPESADLHRALARNLSDLNQVEAALLHANTAKSISPSDPKNSMVRAEVLERLGRLDEAEREYAAQSGAGRQDPDARLRHASVLRQQGRYAEARKILDALIRTHPRRGDLLYESALCAADMEDWPRARQDLDRAETMGYQQIDPLLRLRVRIKNPSNASARM